MSRSLFAASMCLLLALPASTSAGSSLLEEVRHGNQAALQSIHTFYCRIAVAYEPKAQVPPPAGEYWRSLDTVRVRWHLGNQKFESILKDSRVWTLGGADNAAAVGRYDGSPLGMCDAWRLGLFTLPAHEKIAVATFNELLDQPHELQGVERRTENGAEFVVIKISHARARQELWFERGVNFLIRKDVATWPTGQRSESEVMRFTEVAPGVFFPEEVETRSFSADGKLLRTQRNLFSNFRVNQPLPPESFRVRFSPGTELQDLIAGKRYKVDENGTPIGSPSDLPQVAPLSAGVTPRTETREEPRPWTRWILWPSVGMVLAGGGLWLVRWRRQTRAR